MIDDELVARAGYEDIVIRARLRAAAAGSSPPRVLVLITSTRVRRESLHMLLERLRDLRPALGPQVRLAIRLDGYSPSDGISQILGFWPDAEIECSDRLGAGWRWQHSALGRTKDRDIVITLDDDMIPDSASAILDMALSVDQENVAVTYHGSWYEPDGSYLAAEYGHVAERDVPVVAVGAGLAAYRAAWVRDLANHPYAKVMLEHGPAADDDALLALHLWERGVRVIRPRGPSPFKPSAWSNGPTATSSLFLNARLVQRTLLAMAHDCPMIDMTWPVPNTPLSEGRTEEDVDIASLERDDAVRRVGTLLFRHRDPQSGARRARFIRNVAQAMRRHTRVAKYAPQVAALSAAHSLRFVWLSKQRESAEYMMPQWFRELAAALGEGIESFPVDAEARAARHTADLFVEEAQL